MTLDPNGADEPEVADTRSPKSRRNLHTRVCAAMNALPEHPETREVWVVLKPEADDEWTLKKNPQAVNNPKQGLRFVFPTEAAAVAGQGPNGKVFGGWSPVAADEFEVEYADVKVAGIATPVRFDGETYDAIFFTRAARDRFLKSYYAASLGGAPLQTMMAMDKMTGPEGHTRWSRQGAP